MATRRALGSALPTSSAAKITIRRATKSGSSPASSMRAIQYTAASGSLPRMLLMKALNHFVVLVAGLVIEQRASLQGLLDGRGIDGLAALRVGLGDGRGRLQRGQGLARIAPGLGCHKVAGGLRTLDGLSAQARLGSARARSMIVCRSSWESGFSTTTLARESSGGIHLEGRILGRGPDENHRGLPQHGAEARPAGPC